MGGLYHGFQFAIITLLGMAAGYWLDQRLLPSPLGVLGGLFVGSALGIYILTRELR